MIRAASLCLVYFAMCVVNCTPWEPREWAVSVKSRHGQCIDRGFDAACTDTAMLSDSSCQVLKCGRLLINGKYELYEAGEPKEGTSCGLDHICEEGSCKKVSFPGMQRYYTYIISHECI